MGTESEVIRQEMDETRNSLTDKISQLEQQVVETVHEASEGMKQTVEAVKETVQSVKESVGETVDSVKDTFSIPRQVQRHPWMMMAAAAGSGFLAGYLLTGPAAKRAPSVPVRAPRRPGNGSYKDTSVASSSFGEAPAAAAEPSEGVLHQLTQTFENEINQLKGLAIGSLAGLVRDLVVGTIPETMRSSVDEVFDNLTTKLGGKPVRGRIVPDTWHAKPTEDKTERTAEPSSFRPQRQNTF